MMQWETKRDNILLMFKFVKIVLHSSSLYNDTHDRNLVYKRMEWHLRGLEKFNRTFRY